MKFTDAVFCILVLYAVYYIVLFFYDTFMQRKENNVTGVEEIAVIRPPDDNTRVVNYETYMPIFAGEEFVSVNVPESDDPEQGGGFTKKKN